MRKLKTAFQPAMKRKLFAAGLLWAAALPQAASAETWWLLVGGRYNTTGTTTSTFQVPTNSLEQCNAAGQKLMNSKQEPNDIHGRVFDHVRFVCIEGK